LTIFDVVFNDHKRHIKTTRYIVPMQLSLRVLFSSPSLKFRRVLCCCWR